MSGFDLQLVWGNAYQLSSIWAVDVCDVIGEVMASYFTVMCLASL